MLKPETISAMLKPRQLTHWFENQHYGAGWFLERYRGHRVAYHDGTLSGFAAFMLVAPEDDFGAAVVWNSDGARPDELIWEAADLFLPNQEDHSQTAIDFSNFDPTQLVGTYDGDTPLGSVEILDGGSLRARFLDYRVTRALKRISPQSFAVNLPAELAKKMGRKKERLTFWFRGGSVWIVSRVGVARRTLVNTRLQ